MKNRVIVAAVALLCACSPGKQIEKSFDREGQQIRIRVKFYDTEQELQKKKAKIEDSDFALSETGLRGFAAWSEEHNYCEIHTLQPKVVDDEPTLTLGHEMMHCLYGDFHK